MYLDAVRHVVVAPQAPTHTPEPPEASHRSRARAIVVLVK
jgi:hypothetical protein